MKKITLKIDFELPNKYKYIAQDSDGELVAYVDSPKIDEEMKYFYSNSSRYITLAHGAPNENWKESLREI
jgi:hypothetical protein